MVEGMLLSEGRGEGLGLFPERGPVARQGKCHCRAALASTVGQCHSSHEFLRDWHTWLWLSSWRVGFPSVEVRGAHGESEKGTKNKKKQGCRYNH